MTRSGVAEFVTESKSHHVSIDFAIVIFVEKTSRDKYGSAGKGERIYFTRRVFKDGDRVSVWIISVEPTSDLFLTFAALEIRMFIEVPIKLTGNSNRIIYNVIYFWNTKYTAHLFNIFFFFNEISPETLIRFIRDSE
jgi:hypothetical protein